MLTRLLCSLLLACAFPIVLSFAGCAAVDDDDQDAVVDHDRDSNPLGYDVDGDPIDHRDGAGERSHNSRRAEADEDWYAPPPSDEGGVFVAKTGNDAGPGTMAAPKLTIGAGVAAAGNAGKVVFVAGGAYEEGVVVGASLFGGYDAADWSRDLAAQPTAIRGCLGDPMTRAAFVPADETVVVEGFLINDGVSPCVRGVDAAAGSDLTLAHNTIYGGAPLTFRQGAAVHLAGQAARLEANTIYSSAADVSPSWVFGVAVFAESDMDLSLIGNVVQGGEIDAPISYTYGVAVDAGTYAVTALLADNWIDSGRNNSINGVAISGARAVLVNNVIRSGDGEGAIALRLDRNASGLLVNNVLDANTETDFAVVYADDHQVTSILVNNVLLAGPYVETAIYARGQMTLMNNDIWGPGLRCRVYTLTGHTPKCISEVKALNACAWNHCARAGGNISADPAVVDQAAGDYHLLADSPGRDAGVDPAMWDAGGWPAYDIDGDARPQGPGWDIGVDEYVADRAR